MCPRSSDPSYVVSNYTQNGSLLPGQIVLILDGDSEIVAHVLSVFNNLMCLRHFSRSEAIVDLIFLPIIKLPGFEWLLNLSSYFYILPRITVSLKEYDLNGKRVQRIFGRGGGVNLQ